MGGDKDDEQGRKRRVGAGGRSTAKLRCLVSLGNEASGKSNSANKE